MKKYICPNCGFRYSWQTKKYGKKRSCKNCGCKQVYKSIVVIESMMRIDVMKESMKNECT